MDSLEVVQQRPPGELRDDGREWREAANAQAAPHPPVETSPMEQLSREWSDLRTAVVSIAGARVASLRQLTALRRVNEDLQNSFLELERHLPPNASTPVLVFADERQSPEARVTLGRGSPSIEQVLPVASTGFSALELNIGSVSVGDRAILRVQLQSLEDQRVIDQWTIPGDKLVPGWAMLPLTRPPVGENRTLALRLDLETDVEAGLSFYLGRLQPVRLFQVRNAATGSALRPNAVAMRLWCGEPFAATAVATTVLLADPPRTGRHGTVFHPLSQALLAGAAFANKDDVRFDFAPVSHFPYRGAVACHPPARGMTIATLPLPASWRISGVAADVEVGNEQSKPVDFAVAIASDLARAKDLLASTAAPAVDEAVSAWVSCPYGRREPLDIRLRERGRGRTQIFLATRMTTPGNNNFAWARFLGLSIDAGNR